MRQTRELIEAEGYQVIYGDTDSTFVWLKQPHDEQQAADRPGAGAAGQRLVAAASAAAVRAGERAGAGVRNPLFPLPDADHSRRRTGQQEALRRPDRTRRRREDGVQRPGNGAYRLDAAGAAVPAAALSTHLQTAALPGLCARLRRQNPERRLRRSAGLPQAPAQKARRLSAQRTAARPRRASPTTTIAARGGRCSIRTAAGSAT